MSARDDRHTLGAVEAEAALIGGLLLNNQAWDALREPLLPEQFTVPLYRTVFTEIARQLEAGQPTDVVTVATALGGQVGLSELNALAQYIPSPASMQRYAGLIAERHRARALLAAAGEIADLAREGRRPLIDRINEAQAALARLTLDAPRDDWASAYDGMVAHSETLEARAEGKAAVISTGLQRLDDQLDGGLRPGQLVVLGARPSMGKSALSMTIALNVSERVPVGFLSLEMSHDDLRDRKVAMLGRVKLSSVIRPHVGDGLDWGRVVEGIERAKTLQFFASDQPGLNIRQVVTKARGLKRTHGLGLLVVDYLGLLAGLDPKQPRTYQLEEATRSLKVLAKDLSIAVLCLAQLNRQVEQRGEPMPVLSDLRDSGAIEQDADVVLLLHRPIASNPELGDEWSDYAKLRVAKARQGRTGDVNLRYVGEQVRFEDWNGPPPTRTKSSRGRDL
ncbi:replicative DNA helicase [Variovorax defluvii]|uniref:DNA 5'-3' helicase n=1 Tax=Variovorax defluvii TaxID=913761 RepID=A0ABP8I7M6_9BURK